MRSRGSQLLVVLVLIALTAAPVGATPDFAPCIAGPSYDPACDADQDGDIDVFDLQLAAGHWDQTGVWTSDNTHDHLGQTWTGAGNPLTLDGAYGAPTWAPLILNNSAGPGLRIGASGGSALWVEAAGNNGLLVDTTGADGVHVGLAGQPSASYASSSADGFEVTGAQGNGLYVGRADSFGVRVNSAGDTGLSVGSAGNYGLYVDSAGSIGVRVNSTGGSGLYVDSAGSYGLYVDSAGSIGADVTGAIYAAIFHGDIFVSGACTGCLQATFAVNAGSRALQPGDVVSVLGVTRTNFDSGAIWQVAPAQPGQTVVGVVAGLAELVTAAERRPTETGKLLATREGPAAPGEYVTIVYSGPARVRVAATEGAIDAGARLAAATDGTVRPLGTVRVLLADGSGTADIAENNSIVGIALDAPGRDGLVWALINPQ